MTREEFMEMRITAIERETILMDRKGEEYRAEEDVLANFKEDGPAVGVDDPMKTLMIYAGKHWRSIQRYVRTGKEGAEPIQGRIDDLVNYMHLLLGLIEEKRKQNETSATSDLWGGQCPVNFAQCFPGRTGR